MEHVAQREIPGGFSGDKVQIDFARLGSGNRAGQPENRDGEETSRSLHMVNKSHPKESPIPARERGVSTPTCKASILANVRGSVANACITRLLNHSRSSRVSMSRDIRAGRSAKLL